MTSLLMALLFAAGPVSWPNDWNAAFQTAKQQHRLVLVQYYKNSCKPCYDVDTHVLPNRDLSSFITLRVDVDRNAIPREHRFAAPAYVVFDPDARELFRISGEEVLRIDDWHAPKTGLNEDDYPFFGPLDRIRDNAPAFLRAAQLFEGQHDLEANFVLAATYARLRMTGHARAAYAAAQKIAEKRGAKALAQSAEMQAALTYIHEDNPARAVAMLKEMLPRAVSHDVEAMVWLTLGRANEFAKEPQAAIDAYQHARSLAPRESRTYADADASLSRLQQ